MRDPQAINDGNSQLFSGVRFVLFGFDEAAQIQYQSELENGGAIDVSPYNSSCTHVIVHRLTYNDPVCVEARHDGKTLVSALWVEDSLEFGKLADANQILYKPVRDLNGIRGCQSMHICLTGYQKQERSDIMKMVDLMGAQFTKPLIASKVTHLVCYKFEGEKYNLAKKLGIKLINHRWLEDCLKAWDILPEDRYRISGWELEMLEAEARDSEEETTKAVIPTTPFRARGNSGVLPLQSEVLRSTNSDISMPQGARSIQKKTDAAEASSAVQIDIARNDMLFSTPCKEAPNRKDHVPCDGTNKECNEMLSYQDMGAKLMADNDHVMEDIVVGGDTTTSIDEVQNHMVGANLVSSEKKTPKRSHSSAINVTPNSMSYSRKISKKSTMAELLDELSSGLNSSSLKTFGENDSIKNDDNVVSTAQPFKTSVHRVGEEVINVEKLPQWSTGKGEEAVLETGAVPFREGKALESQKHIFETSLGNGHSAETVLDGLPLHQTRINVNPSVKEENKRLECNALVNCTENGQTGSTENQCATLRKKTLKRRPLISKKGEHKLDLSLSKMAGIPTNGELKAVLDMQMDMSNGSGESIMKNLKPTEAVTADVKPKTSLNGFQTLEMPTKSENDNGLLNELASLSNHGISEESKSHQSGKSPESIKSAAIKLQSSTIVEECDNGSFDKKKDGEHNNVEDKKLVPKKSMRCRAKLSTSDLSKGKSECPSGQSGSQGEVTICAEKADETGLYTGKSLKDLNTEMEDLTVKPDDCMAVAQENEVMSPKSISRKNVKKNAIVSETSMDAEKENKLIPTGEETSESAKPQYRNGRVFKKILKGKKTKVENSTMNLGTQDKVAKLKTSLKKSVPENVILNDTYMARENENKRIPRGKQTAEMAKPQSEKAAVKSETKTFQNIDMDNGFEAKGLGRVRQSAIMIQPAQRWFILSGHPLQKKEFQQVIKKVRGKLCKDSHNWSYQATHFIVPDPVRRTEKFFAAAAAGRWILKTDYLTSSYQAGWFLEEEPFEWHKSGLSEDGAINLEAPRKWRLLREKTGHGAFYGMRIVVYGECIAPTLDSLKRVVKAGDGVILATSPPYTRLLKSGVDYAVVSPGMPHADAWVQEFMHHGIPCILADYLVEYVCKPGYPLDRHVLFKMHDAAKKSYDNLMARGQEVVKGEEANGDDTICDVCHSGERANVMLLCGDENGAGCGVGRHIDCCDPPFEAVPEEDWFCSERCKPLG
ncbi:BRCT domain-containing protein At4g02110 isoform X1 [Amborella trichopoda]|uniref:BRCT domain-containing protein n=3 Tax=Amborella trichopoda TaxID=13333 RepID=U5D8Q2_AMBTC|nr:BRCT domain-containing protein At4g02110 isoform X1 [Amborella trichopoda]XP_020529853.1 BRCT domain-containing protein At4g02110 isoform X1 [Amborella trichopoda]ERN16768.1 hypothetical protein AMTR_s00057p00057240 [Amborella trichopoda]|eukprot:XP_006855301.1 BRCT domain-containing protein At4g02110 isoform X1 [Amborella trichopoda]